MRVMNTEIPQAAVDAGRAAMTDRFSLEDVRGAVGTVLHDLYHEGGEHAVFDYGAVDKHKLHDRVADRIVQAERKLGHVRYTSSGKWVRQGCPQPRAKG